MTSTLSGSRKPSQVVHSEVGHRVRSGLRFVDTACGSVGVIALTAGCGLTVTCKRCVTSLARRDRAFQRKARRGLRRRPVRNEAQSFAIVSGLLVTRFDASRAIAREEGRA